MHTNFCGEKVLDRAARSARAWVLVIVLCCLVLGPGWYGQGLSVRADNGPLDKKNYLPLILFFDPLQPLLVSPASGLTLNTLAPVLQWDYRSQPAGTTGCLTFATTANPTMCMVIASVSSGSAGSFSFFYNLNADTLYYWRVGVYYNNDQTRIKWSEVRTFRTAPANGPYPAAPTLIAPADQSTLQRNQLLFTWSPVSGVSEYHIYLHNPQMMMTSIFSTSEAQFDLRYSMNFPDANVLYDWYVVARNSYGWGTGSAKRTFTFTSSLLPGGLLPTAPARPDAFIKDGDPVLFLK